MAVSKNLKELAKYVTESTGEERTYALCVFTDFALREGTKDAERYCAQVLSFHLYEEQSGGEADDLSDSDEKQVMARKVTVDSLVEFVALLDRNVDKELVRRIAKSALLQIRVESDKGIRAKLSRLLQSLGVPLEKIPASNLVIFAAALLAARYSLAA